MDYSHGSKAVVEICETTEHLTGIPASIAMLMHMASAITLFDLAYRLDAIPQLTALCQRATQGRTAFELMHEALKPGSFNGKGGNC